MNNLISIKAFRERLAAQGMGEYGQAWIRSLCKRGRIPGAMLQGRDWYVPADAVMPAPGKVGRKPWKRI